jgi:hypothetical protein
MKNQKYVEVPVENAGRPKPAENNNIKVDLKDIGDRALTEVVWLSIMTSAGTL